MTNDYNELFNRKNWLSWKQLRDKLKNKETLSDFEVYQTAWYMLSSDNGPLVIDTYNLFMSCPLENRNLFRVHPLVVHSVLKEIDTHMKGGSLGQVDEENEMLSEQNLQFTKPR